MKYTLLVTAFLFFNTVIFAQPNGDDLSIGKKYSIKSEILKETRCFNVYLPPSYNSSPDKKYIVAYVLDGDKSKLMEVAGIVHSMNSIQHLKMQIPELIIVGIENTNRTRDFTPTHSLSYLEQENIMAFSSSGKANDFMHFLEKELIPHIDKSYRTLSKNMIIGHSFGGLFAIHTLLESPDLFSYYILIDPSWFWDKNYVGRRAKEVLNQRPDLKAKVYISLANNLKDDPRHYQWGQEFFQLLDAHPSPTLDAKIQYFEDEKHLTVPLPSTYYGLRYIFNGFEIDINDVFMNPAVINEHDQKVSKELGVEIKLDEMFVNTLGYIALHDRNIPDIAVSIFEINTKNYPLSLNVWDSLADAYIAKGQTGKAKACYKKILALSPSNKTAKDKLAKLK